MAQPLFGIVPAGLPVVTAPTEAPSPTSFLYSLAPPPPPSPAAGTPPDSRPFSHVVVFLLPGVALPPATAAAIYLVTPPAVPGQTAPSSRFLGGIGPGKESAIFKLGADTPPAAAAPTVLGISIEDAASVSARIEELRASKTALVPAGAAAAAAGGPPSTLVLAQRIIQNAFNFLASFSNGAGAGSPEVVPLRAFEEWWRKFEGRVRSDPTFLERAAE